MDIFLHPDAWISLLTLTFLEIVLGIDNIIFISIVSNKLSADKQKPARITGLSLALIVRIFLLMGISWIIHMKEPLFSFEIGFLDMQIEPSMRDMVLFLGGLFLLAKSTSEIHHKMTGIEEGHSESKPISFKMVIIQIILLDIIFSFDSILTAVGLTEHVEIMIAAVIIAMIIMMIFSGKVSNFINKYPTLQILALSFLILIGFMLIVESLHYHVPKGYIYFAVFFSLVVEFVNIKIRKKNFEKTPEVNDEEKSGAKGFAGLSLCNNRGLSKR